MKTWTTAIFFILFFSAELYPQWVRTNGPYGGQIFTLVNCGDTLFAVSLGKIYFSVDNGTKWTKIDAENLKDVYVSSLYACGTTLFAGTDYESIGVYRSKDFGMSWTAAGKGLPANESFRDFIICGSYIFVGTNGNGVYRSGDSGESWIKVNSGLPPDATVRAFAVNGSNIFAGIAGSQGGVFLSTNNGQSWGPVNSGLNLNDNFILSLASTGKNIFAGTNSGGLFRSTNNGASWTKADSGLPSKAISSLAVNVNESGETELYAGSWDGVFRSTNNGASWTSLNLAFSGWTWVNCFAFTPNGSGGTHIFAGTFGTYGPGAGIFRSDNDGESWIPVNRGIPDTHVYAIGVNESDIFASTINGVFSSRDNGDNWSDCNLNLQQNNYVNCFAFIHDEKATNIFAGTIQEGIFLSIDNGASWTPVNSGLTNINISSLVVCGSNLFAGTNEGVFLSTNNGASWTPVNSGLTNDSVSSLAVSGSDIFAGTAGGVFRSTDNGTSWKPIGLMNSFIELLAVSDTRLFAFAYDRCFFHSTNYGATWTDIISRFPDPTHTYIYSVAFNGKNIFAGGSGLFVSTDNGVSWSKESNFVAVSSLAVRGTELYAAAETLEGVTLSGLGLWHRPLSEMVTAVKTAAELPKEFALGQNYPNPFNTSTVISYQLHVGARVTITIYDVLGNGVAALVNEEKPAGSFEVTWNAENRSSGVYYCQLRAGSFTATKKLLLMK